MYKKKTKPALWTKAFPPKVSTKTKKRLRKISPNMAKKLKVYSSLKRDYLLRNQTCQRCHVHNSVELHHRRGRLGTLLTDVRYFSALCAKCHRYIHDCPEWARREGWICEKGKWNSTK